MAACIGIHAFALQCKDEELSDSGSDEDPFIAEGLSLSSDSDVAPSRHREHASQLWLQAAKAQREQLKQALFRAKDHRRRR